MKKRADGRYCKQILVGYTPEGKKKIKTIYGKTIKEVEKKERDLRKTIDDGIVLLSENDNLTFAMWAKEWLFTYKKNNVEKTTYLMYQNSVEKHLIPQIGNILLKDIKTTHLQRLLNSKIENNNIRTAEICKLTLKQIFQQAVNNRMIIYNPVAGLQPIKKFYNEKRTLSNFEQLSIEKSALSLKQKCFIHIMRYAGLRKGEVLALTLNKVDFQQSTITVNNSLAFIGNNYLIKSPKSHSSKRIVTMPRILKEELQTYVNTISNEILFPAPKSKDFMTQSSFTKFWKKIMNLIIDASNKVRIENEEFYDEEISFTPHICRHTYATDLYYAGVDIKTAQYLLGHSSIDITLKIYTHVDRTKIGQSIEKLEEYIQTVKNQSNDENFVITNNSNVTKTA